MKVYLIRMVLLCIMLTTEFLSSSGSDQDPITQTTNVSNPADDLSDTPTETLSTEQNTLDSIAAENEKLETDEVQQDPDDDDSDDDDDDDDDDDGGSDEI